MTKSKKVFKLPNKNKIKNYDVFEIEDKNVTDYSHIIHKYPSKFIPQIPKWAIEQYSKEGEYILDPFLGSGTTAVEALILNRNTIGLDINPIAKLISEVKTSKLDSTKIDKYYIELIENVNKDKKTKKSVIPKINDIEKWFSDESINCLSRLKFHILKIKEVSYRNFFLVIFSAIIRKSSNAEYRSQKTYVSSRFKSKQIDVIKLFEKRYKQYFEGLTKFVKEVSVNNSNSEVINKSANNFHYKDLFREEGKNVDLAITSPPYVNAVLYPSVFQLEYQWLDFFKTEEINEHRKIYIGTDRVYSNEYKDLPLIGYEKIDDVLEKIYKKDKKKAYMVYKYFADMKANMECVYGVLKKEGKYVIVVGNNIISGYDVLTSEFLIDIAKSIGYELELIYSYLLKDRHLVFINNNNGKIIDRDWIIVLNKK